MPPCSLDVVRELVVDRETIIMLKRTVEVIVASVFVLLALK